MTPDLLKRFGSSSITETLGSATTLFKRGPTHQDRLSEVDTRIVVSGTRGKSSLTRYLYDLFDSRGYDAYAKVTGNHPVSLYDEEHPIERDGPVTLYENEAELRQYCPSDVVVFENQAIGDYTSRMFNATFADPHIVVFTNVRQDHLDSLGSSRADIARSLCRAIPEDTIVVNGEQDPELQSYIETELDRVDASVTHVDVPPEHEAIPGAEVIYAIDTVLDVLGKQPMSSRRRRELLSEFRVEWTTLPGGRIFNAASVNDVESTELVRQSLQRDDELIEPFVHLRSDRRSRTISFLEYTEKLEMENVFERVHVAGGHASLFERYASFPVIVHDKADRSPTEVLDGLLDAGHPVFVMGNTVAQFMREFEVEIQRRASRVEAAREDPEPDLPALSQSTDRRSTTPPQ